MSTDPTNPRRLSLALALLAAACGETGDVARPSVDPTVPAPGAGDTSGGAGASSSGAPGGGSSGSPGSPGRPGGSSEPPPVPYRHFDVNHVLSTGQSNSVANGGTPVLTTAQPYGNLAFDTGVMPGQSCDGSGCRAYAKPIAFVPLVEGDRFFSYAVETMSSGLANEITKLGQERFLAGKPRHDVLVTLHGRSGNTYFCLRKGGCDFKGEPAGYLPPFTEAMMHVADAKALAQAAGKSYVVRAVTAIHGESDHYSYSTNTAEFPLPSTHGGPVVTNYADGMLEWQHDYEEGVKAITGQAVPVPLLMLQMSNWNDVPQSKVATWQLEAHVRAPGKVVVVAPGYAIGYASDCLHFTNHGERRIGEYFAKAYARIVMEGRPWEPLRPKSVTLAGNVITAQFVVPKPPLVLDTSAVVNPGNYGFEVVDGSATPPAITNVAVTAPDKVTITLASAPTGPVRLQYAYRATPQTCPGTQQGPRGNLRDSDDTPSLYGYDLANWAVHFDEPVP
ncbi:MAG: hypothetical protein JST00_44260 [Deltaproteobacteria bacterium]|nr:hypothetical protein [Deltaproteobacteria bacterium]